MQGGDRALVPTKWARPYEASVRPPEFNVVIDCAFVPPPLSPNSSRPRARRCGDIGGQTLGFSEMGPLARAYEIVHGDVERIVHHAVEFTRRPRVRGKAPMSLVPGIRCFLLDLGVDS